MRLFGIRYGIVVSVSVALNHWHFEVLDQSDQQKCHLKDAQRLVVQTDGPHGDLDRVICEDVKVLEALRGSAGREGRGGRDAAAVLERDPDGTSVLIALI